MCTLIVVTLELRGWGALPDDSRVARVIREGLAQVAGLRPGDERADRVGAHPVPRAPGEPPPQVASRRAHEVVGVIDSPIRSPRLRKVVTDRGPAPKEGASHASGGRDAERAGAMGRGAADAGLAAPSAGARAGARRLARAHPRAPQRRDDDDDAADEHGPRGLWAVVRRLPGRARETLSAPNGGIFSPSRYTAHVSDAEVLAYYRDHRFAPQRPTASPRRAGRLPVPDARSDPAGVGSLATGPG